MIITIIVGMVCLFIGYAIGLGKDECPRQILQYKCQGDACNHSKNEVRRAKETMGL